MKHFNKIFLVAISIAVLSCDSKEETASSYDRKPILVNISDSLILPAYSNFQLEVSEFQSDLNIYENESTEANMKQLKEAWIQMALAWKYAEAYNFGPIESLFLENSMHYFPVDTAAISKAVENYSNQENYLASLGSNKKGLAAIEFILFSNEELSGQQLAFIQLLSTDLSNNMDKVLDKWNTAYHQEFIDKTGNSASSSMTLVANEMIFLLEKVKNMKLGEPMGKADMGEPHPAKVESPYSNISLKLLAENVESVKDVFNGGNGAGMDDYLNALDVKDDEGLLLTKKINQQFDKVINIARSIEDDLSSAIINHNPKLDELYLEMINLTIIIKNDMMSQLGLLTVFSDNDGD